MANKSWSNKIIGLSGWIRTALILSYRAGLTRYLKELYLGQSLLYLSPYRAMPARPDKIRPAQFATSSPRHMHSIHTGRRRLYPPARKKGNSRLSTVTHEKEAFLLENWIYIYFLVYNTFCKIKRILHYPCNC